MTYHAKLSPSGAHRWAKCPASVVLEAPYPRTSSVYADWGTAVHHISAEHLLNDVDLDDFLNVGVDVGDALLVIDQDMIDCAKSYVQTVRDLQGGCEILVEYSVPIDHLTDEENARGTADCIVLDIKARCLTVIDLKTGMGVKVEAKDNDQLMMYASGALREVEYLSLGEFDTVELVIVQPRLFHLSVYTITVEELREFENRIRNASRVVYEVMALGVTTESFNPGESQCRFCKARANCAAAANQALTIVADDFVNLDQEVLPQLASIVERVALCDTSHLARCYEAIPMIKDWMKAVEARMRQELTDGNEVPGFKLVEGKRGNREWIDEAQAQSLLASAGLSPEQYIEQNTISPTKAEKLLKGNPIWKEISQTAISQPSGSPAVAPNSDKRPALALNTLGDFANLTLENPK